MKLDVNFVIPVMGAAFVLIGIYIRLGNLKQVYWRSRRSVIGYIPLGLVFIAAGYYDQASKQTPILYYAYLAVFVLLAGLTLYIAIRTPDFMKPTWIRWVEKHPRAIQKAMAAAVEDDDAWKTKVTSQAAVDAWAKELARRLPALKSQKKK